MVLDVDGVHTEAGVVSRRDNRKTSATTGSQAMRPRQSVTVSTCRDPARLNRGAERLVKNGRQDVTTVVVEGVPVALGILRTAEQKAAELIVMPTHGRGGLPR